MRKKLFVVMMAAFCMVLGGCGSSGDSSAVSDVPHDESYEYDDVSSDEEGHVELEDECAEDDDMSVPEETEELKLGEIEGLVAMVRSSTEETCDVQVINIVPETGSQNVISEFHVGRDNDTYYYRADTRYTMRSWFSGDFTKMAIDARIISTGEYHTGWIDTDGTFFDVTEASRVESAKDFFNTASTQHRAIGFVDDKFVFFDVATEEFYSTPIDNVTNNVEKLDESDTIVALLSNLDSGVRLTCQTPAGAYIVDAANSTCSQMMDLETGEKTDYIPDAERWVWNGVLSPDDETVAFLSTPKNGGAAELYTMPMADENPVAVPWESNITISMTTEWNVSGSGAYSLFSDNSNKECCYLLEWR